MALARKKPAFIGPVRPTSRANMSVAPTTPNMSVAPVPFIGPTRPAPVVNAPVNTVIPIRNDLQANGGAGYNELLRLSASGSVNPDSVQASSFSSFSTGQTSPTPGVTLGQNSSNPTSNVVNAFNMNPTDPANTKAKFDELTVPNYQGVIPAARDTTQKPEADNNYAEIFKQLTDAEDKNKIPSSADAYNRAQRETGILQAQQNVSNLTGTLNGIVAQGQANQLSLVGQGRGIPEAIIGGQQAQIARETAIQALPVSAQLNAAQGNLEMAQANVETLFKIYSDDATNAYNRKTKKNEMVFNFLNAQEKTRLEKIQKLEDRAYTESLAVLKRQQDFTDMALKNNQGGLAAQFMALQPNSPTYQKDFSTLVAKINDPMMKLDMALKNAQLSKIKSDSKAEKSDLLSIDDAAKLGVPYGTTKSQAIALQGQAPSTQIQIESFNNAQALLDKVTSKGLNLFGSVPIGPGSFGPTLPGTKRADFIAIENSLKAQLTLDNLKYLKGPTSDKDVAFITTASTSLSRKMSPELYESTLRGIRDTLGKYSPEYKYAEAAAGMALQSGALDPYQAQINLINK